MVGIYGKTSELIEDLQGVIQRGEPMMDLGPQLLERGLHLMEKSTLLVNVTGDALYRTGRLIERIETLCALGEAVLEQMRRNGTLEQRRLELEIQRLEREASIEGSPPSER